MLSLLFSFTKTLVDQIFYTKDGKPEVHDVAANATNGQHTDNNSKSAQSPVATSKVDSTSSTSTSTKTTVTTNTSKSTDSTAAATKAQTPVDTGPAEGGVNLIPLSALEPEPVNDTGSFV